MTATEVRLREAEWLERLDAALAAILEPAVEEHLARLKGLGTHPLDRAMERELQRRSDIEVAEALSPGGTD